MLPGALLCCRFDISSLYPFEFLKTICHTFWQLKSFDSHTNNVMAVGFQCDGNWMYSGSEDGTVKIWDLRYCRYQVRCLLIFPTSYLSSKSTYLWICWMNRAPGCQREYESRAAVNTVVLHPNQVVILWSLNCVKHSMYLTFWLNVELWEPHKKSSVFSQLLSCLFLLSKILWLYSSNRSPYQIFEFLVE